MIPFENPESLTAEEKQFLADNKASYLLQVIYKCCKIAYQTQEYLEHIDPEIDNNRMAYHKGKRKGSFEVYNLIRATANSEVSVEKTVTKLSPRAIEKAKRDSISLRTKPSET